MPPRRDPRFGELELSNYELLEAAGEAFYALDHAWRFTFVNERAEQLLQRQAPELLGRVLWDEFPLAANTVLEIEFHRALREDHFVEFTNFYESLAPAWFSVRAVPYSGGLLSSFGRSPATSSSKPRRENWPPRTLRCARSPLRSRAAWTATSCSR